MLRCIKAFLRSNAPKTRGPGYGINSAAGTSLGDGFGPGAVPSGGLGCASNYNQVQILPTNSCSTIQPTGSNYNVSIKEVSYLVPMLLECMRLVQDQERCKGWMLLMLVLVLALVF